MGEEHGRSPLSAGRATGPSDLSPASGSSRSSVPNAARFTPGPWGLNRDDFNAAGCFVAVSTAGVEPPHWHGLARVVVRMVDAETDHPEGVANARLIAAAPDLYEALELFAQLKVPAKPEGNAGFYSIPFERIARAQAALAKARGERLSSMDAKVAG